MTIPVKAFQDFVSDMTALWGEGLGIVPALSPGSFVLALFEAVAAQADFLQAQNLQVLALTRAATSNGADLDTWMADFNFPRLPATFATGPVTLSSATTTTTQINIAAATLVNGVYQGGALVTNQGASQVYRVIPDVLQTAYQSIGNSYILTAGGTSVTVTVQALASGIAGNIAAGQITQMASQQAGISLVSNPVAFNNGVAAETDAAFRARFVLYLSTLAKATKSALLAAAQSVQQGLQVALAENTLPSGTTQLGTFTTFVDNGTGAPPTSLLNQVYTAMFNTRAFTVQPFVVGPTIFNVPITLAIRPATGFTMVTLQPLVQNAIISYVETLAAGQTLFVSAVETAALSVTGVVAVAPGTTINSINQDYVPTATQEVRTVLSSVTVNQY